jgi:hypothetical protein
MIVAIHQPEFFPWLGFFDKMRRADRYVVLDIVQFKKRYFENRNRIKLNSSPHWITVPVQTKGKFYQKIYEVKIASDAKWQRKMYNTICHAYQRSPYFHRYKDEIESLICRECYEFLIHFNLAIIQWFRKVFNIQTPIFLASELSVHQFSSSRLILEICRQMEATHYLCGSSGKNYLNLNDFNDFGIEIVFQNFKHPLYPQVGDGFISYLSSLDYILNCGAGQLTDNNPHSEKRELY